MLSASAIDCITRVRLGFVASVIPNGRPSVPPKGAFVVLDGRMLAFGAICSPGTISNIGHSQELVVNFVGNFTCKGWWIRGTTSVLRRGSAAFDAFYPQSQVFWVDLAGRINAIVVLYKDNFVQMYP